MSKYSVKDEPIVISKYLLDMFLNPKSKRYASPEHPSDLIAMYMFYYYTAKWQKTNSVRATTGYVAEGLKWSIPRVQRSKKVLMELGLIEERRERDETGRIGKIYIQVNFIWGAEATEEVVHHPRGSPPSGKTLEWKNHAVDNHAVEKPSVENPTTNALSDNSLNALSENKENALSDNRESAQNFSSLNSFGEHEEEKTEKNIESTNPLPLEGTGSECISPPTPSFPHTAKNPKATIPRRPRSVPFYKPPHTYGKDSPEMWLVAVFCKALKEHMPEVIPPDTPREITGWAAEMGSILEKGYKSEAIIKAIEFASTDDWWKGKIAEPRYLRNNISRLVAQMSVPKKGGMSNRAREAGLEEYQELNKDNPWVFETYHVQHPQKEGEKEP